MLFWLSKRLLQYNYFQRLFDLNMLSFQLKNFESLHKGGKCQMVFDSLIRHKLWRPFQKKLFTSTDIAFWRVNIFSESVNNDGSKLTRLNYPNRNITLFSRIAAVWKLTTLNHPNRIITFFSNCNTKYGTSVTCENQQQHKTWLAIFSGSVNAV